MRLLKELILTSLLLIVSFFSFYLIKISVLVLPIFIYSIVLYVAFRKLSYPFLIIFGLLFGGFYSVMLFYISNIGIEVFYLFSAGIAIFFACFLIFSKIISTVLLKKNSIVELIFFILFFWFFKISFFYFFLREASFLLNAPPHFTFLFSILGSSGTIALLMVISLFPFYFYIHRRSLFVVSSLLSILVLFVLLFISFQPFQENLPSKVTFVQSSFNDSLEVSILEDSLSYNFYLPAIQNISEGIIILPETSYMANLGADDYFYKVAYQNVSKGDKLVIFGGYEANNSHVRNVAYVYYNQTLLGEHLSTNPYDNPDSNLEYITQETPTVFDSPYGKFVVLICFEALHRSSIKNIDLEELDFVVVISNNYFTTSQEGLNTLVWNIQDLAAVNSIPVFAVSNNGPSVYVDSKGNVVARTKDFESTVLTLEN